MTHKDKAIGRGEKDSVILLLIFFISFSILWIRYQPCSSIFMLGASSANLLCFREAGRDAWRGSSLPAHSLLHLSPLGKTGHLLQLTCLHSAPECVRKSQTVYDFSALGVFPFRCPLFFDSGPKETEKQLCSPQDQAWKLRRPSKQ